MTNRETILKGWLEQNCPNYKKWVPLPGDASFRRYHRIYTENNTFIAVDAPPPENCETFVAIANGLRLHGLLTPTVFSYDKGHGFMLLSDMGDNTYLKILNSENYVELYNLALDALAILQRCPCIDNYTIPVFTAHWMRQELEWFKEWFLNRYLKISSTAFLNPCFDNLVEKISKQPYVFSHRDYHSGNLMYLSEGKVGVLDFQDAFLGPITYDVVSLLRDCYIAWPEQSVRELCVSYFFRLKEINQLTISQSGFLYWIDMMGIQRHLKALMTFSRKFCRDQNSYYLQYIPRTLDYLIQVSARYNETAILSHFLKEEITCAQ